MIRILALTLLLSTTAFAETYTRDVGMTLCENEYGRSSCVYIDFSQETLRCLQGQVVSYCFQMVDEYIEYCNDLNKEYPGEKVCTLNKELVSKS